MTLDITIVFAILVAAVVLFVLERLRVDLVALLVVAALVASGILTGTEAIAGFSNRATVTVAAMMVLSGGLARTRALDAVGTLLTRLATRTKWGGLGALLGTVGIISAFINNTAAVAIFLPIALRIARGAAMSPSKLLIPLSYAGILGGTCTLIGTSTNLLVDTIAVEHGQPPFGMFEFLPLGIVLFAVGLTYTMTVGRRLLPERRSHGDLAYGFDEGRYAVEVELGEESEWVGEAVASTPLAEASGREVLDVFRAGERLTPPLDEIELKHGDVLHVRCEARDVADLRKVRGLTLRRRPFVTEASGERRDVVLTEAVVPASSPLVGQTLGSAEQKDAFPGAPVAIRHRGSIVRGEIEKTRLRAGDLLLLEMAKAGVRRLRSGHSLVFISEHELPRSSLRHVVPAVGIIVGTVSLATANVLPIVGAAMIGAVAMVVTRCLTMEEAYEAIDWQVIFLLAGMLSLGTAMETTGAAELVARWIVDLVGPLGPGAVLSSFYLLTALLTAAMSNNATAVLLAPVAIGTAAAMGADARPFVMAVAFGASASFMSPIGYQTNTLVYGPGRYQFVDYVRVGAPLVLIFWVIASLLIPRIWPL